MAPLKKDSYKPRYYRPFEAVIDKAAARFHAENVLEEIRQRRKKEKIERQAELWTQRNPLPTTSELFEHTESSSHTTACASAFRVSISTQTDPLPSSASKQQTSVEPPPSASRVSPPIETKPKLSRTQLRKQKLKEKFAANPDVPHLSRRERKAANKVAHEIADIMNAQIRTKKHN